MNDEQSMTKEVVSSLQYQSDSRSEQLIDQVIYLSNNFTRIIHTSELDVYTKLCLSRNGTGNRWANKKFNYTVIYSNGMTKLYSEYEDDTIPEYKLNEFLQMYYGNTQGIIGIYVHSRKQYNKVRPIRKDILEIIKSKSCVVCGTNSSIICDHKNDLYNDNRVLNGITQRVEDFQPLCNHCNLRKRQICKQEKIENKIYSAKKMERYQQYLFEFPWEKKAFDIDDSFCKHDTYWYDPVEFERKIYTYLYYIIPTINELKNGCIKYIS